MLSESESDILLTTLKISLDIYYKLLAFLFRAVLFQPKLIDDLTYIIMKRRKKDLEYLASA